MKQSNQRETLTRVIIEGEDGSVEILHLPVRKAYLSEIINSCLSLSEMPETPVTISERHWYEDYVFLRKDDGYKKVKATDVVCLEAQRNYCTVSMADGSSITLSMPMNEVLEYFNPAHFKRVHCSYAVNLEHVDSYIGNMLILNNKQWIAIGREYREQVKHELVCIGSRKRVREKKRLNGG